MRAIIIFCFICCTTNSLAQIDSIITVINNEKGVSRVEAGLNFMKSQLNKNPQLALDASEEILKIFYKDKDSLSITKVLYAQAFLLRRLAREKEAIIILDKAYGLAKRNQFFEELSKIINLKALSYTYTAQYDLALNANFEALTINEKLNNKEDLSISCNNIGLVYFKLKNYEAALEYYRKSLEIKKTINSNFDLDRLYINMALCYNQLGDLPTAEMYVNNGLEVCKDNCANDLKMSAAYCFGIINLANNKLEASEKNYLVAIELSKSQNEKLLQIESLKGLADVYEKQNKLNKALEVLQEAEKLALSSYYYQNLADIYKKNARIHSLKNDFEVSTQYSNKYIQLRDSLMSEELIKNLADVQAKYAERENLSTIRDNEKIIKAQRSLNYAIAFIVVMAFAFIYLIMRNSRTIKKLNAKLALEVEKKTKELIKANHNLKQVNDELDNLVYKTSHDIRGPLATLKGVCNIAIMDVKDPLALSFLHKLDITSSQLNQVLDKFSRVNEIYNTHVRPVSVDIEWVIKGILQNQMQIQRVKKIDLQVNIEPTPDFKTEPNLFYYAMSSVIDNAFKYYNESPRIDSFVNIQVLNKGKEIKIIIRDNGVGIPINLDEDSLFHMFTRGSERSLTGGMGLFIAAISTRKIQGEIQFNRAEDFSFTEFLFDLPMVPDPARIEKPRERH
jgi:signal transduction histidine kinase